MRGLLIAGTVIMGAGLLAVGLAFLFLLLTMNDGGGANIGAGILLMFGLMLTAVGAVPLIVWASAAGVRRVRR